MPVDASIRARLAEVSESGTTVDEICPNCFKNLSQKISAGAQVLLMEKQKEEQKLNMWKNRVALIKHGRQCMSQKQFQEAAVSYEKYIRVLEIIFESAPGTLTPDRVKKAHHTKELTVIASVYWDLLRIYDSSSRYASRQREAARKLAQFLPFTPIYPDIIRKAQIFSRKAKNPAIFRSFLKGHGSSRGKCFIATSAFNSPYAHEVILLKRYRDDVLAQHLLGRTFIFMYYLVSPSVAYILDKHPQLKSHTRSILRKILPNSTGRIAS